MSTQNALAQRLKALHVPGNPLILTNVWDSITASAIASLPETQALATASYAVAAAAGLQDPELDLETNLRAVAGIAKAAKAADKPLTVDFQDGFGEQLEENVRRLVRLGVVGMNLEDHGREVGGLYDVDVAAERVRRALKVAAEEGVPDFVINARTDALLAGLDIDEAIKRGKAYLAAGATTAFLWGGRDRGGMRTEEVMKASEALAGMINVSLVRIMPGGLTVAELKEIGVARISVGPQVMMRTIGAVKEEAGKVLRGEGL